VFFFHSGRIPADAEASWVVSTVVNKAGESSSFRVNSHSSLSFTGDPRFAMIETPQQLPRQTPERYYYD